MAQLAGDIPGYYYDPDKKRYFPISTAHSGRPRTVPASSVSEAAGGDLPGATNDASFMRVPGPLRALHLQGLMSRSRVEEIALSYQPSLVSSFRLANKRRLNLHPSSYAGEATCMAASPTTLLAGASDGDIYRQAENDEPSLEPHSRTWKLERSLSTNITNISILGDRYFATSLGPDPTLVTGTLEEYPVSAVPSSTIHTLPLHRFAKEIWTASIGEVSTALGCDKKALRCRSLEDVPHGLIEIRTKSDVFALYHETNELLMGTRSGAVRLYDIRLPASSTSEILRADTAITNLHVVHGNELLVCTMSGSVQIYDLRSLRGASPPSSMPLPIGSILGHQNSYTRGLGCCVSTEYDILFLAGQDCRIRAWSLRTLDQLKPIPPSKGVQSNPLSTGFIHPIKAMALREGELGLQLHAVDGYVSYAWHNIAPSS